MNEEVLNEDDKLSLSKILKDLTLKKCYENPDKTFNDILKKIKEDIFNIELQRQNICQERKYFASGWGCGPIPSQTSPCQSVMDERVFVGEEKELDL